MKKLAITISLLPFMLFGGVDDFGDMSFCNGRPESFMQFNEVTDLIPLIDMKLTARQIADIKKDKDYHYKEAKKILVEMDRMVKEYAYLNEKDYLELAIRTAFTLYTTGSPPSAIIVAIETAIEKLILNHYDLYFWLDDLNRDFNYEYTIYWNCAIVLASQG